MLKVLSDFIDNTNARALWKRAQKGSVSSDDAPLVANICVAYFRYQSLADRYSALVEGLRRALAREIWDSEGICLDAECGVTYPTMHTSECRFGKDPLTRDIPPV